MSTYLLQHLKTALLRLLLAVPCLVAGAFAAPAQKLIAPAEIVLYVHSDLKSTDFIQPLVCALQRVLAAPVSTRTLDLQLGSELRATATQFDVSKVADRFIRATAADGASQSFKYFLIPYDLKSEPWRYVFSSSFGDETAPYHVGIVSTARLDVGNPRLRHGQGADITAIRAYKLILKSIARVAGLKSPDACVLAFPRSLDELDRKSSEFCPGDAAILARAGILRSNEGKKVTDCDVIAQQESEERLGWVEQNPSHAAFASMGFASTFTTLSFGGPGRSTYPAHSPRPQ